MRTTLLGWLSSALAQPARHAVSRRALLAAGAPLAALATVGASLRQRAPATGTAARSGLDTFMDVSRRLTGRDDLDRALGARLYAGLVRARLDGDGALRALGARLGRSTARLTDLPESDRATAERVLRAWYLGLVGEGAQTQCLAYETILGYRPVADHVVLHSYCRGAPGYWTALPNTEATRA